MLRVSAIYSGVSQQNISRDALSVETQIIPLIKCLDDTSLMKHFGKRPEQEETRLSNNWQKNSP